MPTLPHSTITRGLLKLAGSGVLALLLASTLYAAEPECPIFNLLSAPVLSVQATSIAERARHQAEMWEFSKQTARSLFTLYSNGQITTQEIEVCYEQHPDSQSFQQLLPQVFFEESMTKIRASHSPSIQTLVQQLDEKLGRTRLPLFKLVGHFKIAAPTDSKAGFHRGTESIFLNFAKIHPNEWLIIFAHEVLHGLDKTLTQAISIYGNVATAKSIATLAQTKDDPSLLTTEERAMLEEWLMAGLNRGFLAEVRAWSETVQIYEEGLREGLWTPIGWMEELLQNRDPSQSTAQFVLQTLSPSFQDPTDGIFSLPLVSRALTELRAKILHSSDTSKL